MIAGILQVINSISWRGIFKLPMFEKFSETIEYYTPIVEVEFQCRWCCQAFYAIHILIMTYLCVGMKLVTMWEESLTCLCVNKYNIYYAMGAASTKFDSFKLTTSQMLILNAPYDSDSWSMHKLPLRYLHSVCFDRCDAFRFSPNGTINNLAIPLKPFHIDIQLELFQITRK